MYSFKAITQPENLLRAWFLNIELYSKFCINLYQQHEWNGKWLVFSQWVTIEVQFLAHGVLYSIGWKPPTVLLQKVEGTTEE